MQHQGWYRIPNGPLYFGPVPPGVEEIDPPGAAAAPARVVPERPKRGARKAEYVAWIEDVTGSPLDGTNLTVPELRALTDELVDTLESGGEVGSVALGDEGVADGEQLGDGESPSTEAGDEDAQAFGHED